LIELLVVIVIIAILASLILPALARAKKRTLAVQCRSNARQLGMALLMYMNDSGNLMRYPGPAYSPPNIG